MSNDEKSRLDRLERIVESNARSIEALTNEGRIARNRLYEAMTRLAAAQATFWDIQSDYYQRLEQIDERQARMIELLNRLEERLEK